MAPSPTGYFHVGSARTALYNWLFARQQGGTFVLRIEDTDRARNQPGQIEGIMEALRWLGLEWDEGPSFQSERGELYQDAVEKLLAAGRAYVCDCTPEALAARKEQGATPGYDGYCRDRGLEPGPGRLVRFRTPDQGMTDFYDVVRGHVVVENRRLEDFAIRRSNGQPLFIVANVVDDAEMAISHVIRGEDHLTNTSKYLLCWEALGYGQSPVFAHLPMLLSPRRKKLSKRRDRVAIEDFRADGFLPEAMCNYLALLGWSPGENREIVTREELVSEFRLEDVKSAGAIFDETKLRAFNAEYLRALPTDELVSRATSWLVERWSPAAPLVQERARTFSEVFTLTDFLYLPEPVVDQSDWDRGVAKLPAFGQILDAALEVLAACDWDAQAIKEAVSSAGETAGVPQLGKAQAPVRLAVTGRSVGPPLFESLVLLGRDKTLARLRAGRQRLADSPSHGAP